MLNKENKFSDILIEIPFSYMWMIRHLVGDADTVLDIGCGDGSLMNVVARNKNWKITGIDLYKPWIVEAKKRNIYKDFIQGDLESILKNLIKKKIKYDVVFCSQVIEHIDKKKGERLLALVDKLANKRIFMGTPQGFMVQPEMFLEKNPHQHHKSGWSLEDFSKRGYMLRGVGFMPVWHEHGWARTENKLILYPVIALAYIISPLVYFFPKFGAGILAVKNISHE